MSRVTAKGRAERGRFFIFDKSFLSKRNQEWIHIFPLPQYLPKFLNCSPNEKEI
jgi:hypothetical protein